RRRKNKVLQKFFIGERVRVDLKEVPVEERQCDVGFVRFIMLVHPRTPLERVEYSVRFDKPYIKPEKILRENIYEIICTEEKIEAALDAAKGEEKRGSHE
ncbi:MAG: hypothetical protein NUV49_02815, partial [Patescibacteria group bacterium]|nr:hypothetical protein [Patescibacteria group bacterium]